MKLNFLAFLTIFILILLKSTNSQNASILSIAICEIIRNFYTKYSRNVEIIDFGETQSELVNEIMKNLNNSMTLTLKKSFDPQTWTKKLTNQSILLFNNFEDFDSFNRKDLIQSQYTKTIRILVYCQNATKMDFSRLKTDLVSPPYYYFIIYDAGLKLFTFENRNNLKICHEVQQLVQINEFSIKSQDWINKSIFPKKYLSFHGCEMKLGVFYTANNFLRLVDDHGNIISITSNVDGPLGNFMNDVAERLNFSITYVACLSRNCYDIVKIYYLYNVIHTTTLDGYSFGNKASSKWNNIMLNIQCSPQLYVPPGDLYTSFEKIVLPFDSETWISIGITLLVAILTTFVIRRTKFQRLFSSASKHSSFFDIYCIVFGIGQTKQPYRNFGRIILTSFVLWCLVIRTAYQGKLFEFTTSAIRKPEMKTLEEVESGNVVLYIPNDASEGMLNYISGIIDLDIAMIPINEYTALYFDNLTNPSFPGAILTCDVEHSLNTYYIQAPIPKRFVPIPITKSYYAVGFAYSNLWNERLNEIIEGLITGGIINFHLDKYTKSKWNLMGQKSESEKVVLSLSHLGFGFQICFFALFAAFLVFCVELAVKRRFENPKISISTNEHVKVETENVLVVAASGVLRKDSSKALSQMPEFRSSEPVILGSIQDEGLIDSKNRTTENNPAEPENELLPDLTLME
ncbi:hypothetical protein ACKWTF_016034 [Chironomus riparius]